MRMRTVAGGWEQSRPRTVGRAGPAAASVFGLGLELSPRRIDAGVRGRTVAGGLARRCAGEVQGRTFAGEVQGKTFAGRGPGSRFAVARRTGRRRTQSPAVAVAPVSHVERETHALQRRRRPLVEVLAALAEHRPSRTGPRLAGRGRSLACRIRCRRRVRRTEASVPGMCCTRIPSVMVLAFVRSPGLPSHPSFAPCGTRPATDHNHCASGCRPVRVFRMHLHLHQHPCSRWLRPGVLVARRGFCRFGP